MTKEIGGFFELELGRGNEYHTHAYKVNSGRNALYCLLESRNTKKIYIPYYICESVLEPIKRLQIKYEFYSIDYNFTPIIPKVIEQNSILLYVNYFGLYDHIVEKLAHAYSNIIIDNTQAFFSKLNTKFDAFYSPRKFFGVADGGYFYSSTEKAWDWEQDFSFNRYHHLLKRLDVNAQESYIHFQEHENNFSYIPVKKMSQLTLRILESIDYQHVIDVRNRNFLYLNSQLSSTNLLEYKSEAVNGPLAYPYFSREKGIRERLIQNKIFVAKYWPDVCKRMPSNSVEYDLSEHIIPLPIDQRYSLEQMERIVNVIKGGNYGIFARDNKKRYCVNKQMEK